MTAREIREAREELEKLRKPIHDVNVRHRESLTALARTAEFVEPDQADLPCPVLFAKIFRFRRCPNHFYIRRRPAPLEGRFAIVTDAGRDAVDADGAFDERRLRRTAKSCGPDAPTLASSLR